VPDSLVAQLLTAAGALAVAQTDYARAIELYQGALSRLGSDGDARERLLVLYHLMRLANETGNVSDARARALQNLELCRVVGDKPGMARALNMLGTIDFYDGSEQAGVDWYNQSLVLYRETGDEQGAADVLNNLGEVARLRGDYEEAAALYRASLEPCRQLGDQSSMAITLSNLGYMALNVGDYAQARELFGESLVASRSLAAQRTIALGLFGMASALAGEGLMLDAARLFGTGQALVDRMHITLAPADRYDLGLYMSATRTALSEAEWSGAWAEGYAMEGWEAIEFALARSRAC